MAFLLKSFFNMKYAPLSEKDEIITIDVESNMSRASTEVSDTSSNTEVANTEAPKESGRIDARLVSDAIIGLSDGLTVPFALTAGLSALGDTKVVVFGGLAELIAGAISMGLGGYLGAKSEESLYQATLRRTREQVVSSPTDTNTAIASVFEPYDLPAETMKDLVHHISGSPKVTDFLMHFQHGESEPASSRALLCALTIALGYFVGGFVPLIPYFFASTVSAGLCWSIGLMAFALFVFGYVKQCILGGWGGRDNIAAGLWSGVQMVLIGGAAAGAAMGVVRALSYHVG